VIEGRSSATAAYVAARGALAQFLPAEARLAADPLGWRFAPPAVRRLRPLAERFPSATGRLLVASPLGRLLSWMQLRTRAIDDLVLAFAARGGRQIVLLGAGYDCRAVRLAPRLPGARWFEIDHPATQARKRALLAAARGDDELARALLPQGGARCRWRFGGVGGRIAVATPT
jgi:methyltransferase (TIGR00027 family)